MQAQKKYYESLQKLELIRMQLDQVLKSVDSETLGNSAKMQLIREELQAGVWNINYSAPPAPIGPSSSSSSGASGAATGASPSSAQPRAPGAGGAGTSHGPSPLLRAQTNPALLLNLSPGALQSGRPDSANLAQNNRLGILFSFLCTRFLFSSDSDVKTKTFFNRYSTLQLMSLKFSLLTIWSKKLLTNLLIDYVVNFNMLSSASCFGNIS